MVEEMMIKMMMINTRTRTTPTPTWKLYENPFYTSPHNHQNQQESDHQNQIHRLHLPVSTRKIATSFWDLTFIKPFMDSELETSRAHIMELKAQLDYERKARKKLTKELSAERKAREALETVCQDLAVEISRLKTDMEEERKMLRVAEVLREERVQMKLTDAKIMLEEKMSELQITKKNDDNKSVIVLGDKYRGKKVSLEAENPHIKRGIRGFVEFPKVVRAIGSRSRHLGTKLECQKAQLMILLKQRTQIESNNLIMS